MSKSEGGKKGTKPVQTVQTLIAPRLDLSKKDKDTKSSEKSSKMSKRTHSDVEKSDQSFDTSTDFTDLVKNLQDIKDSLKETTKKEDLTNALKDVVKQADIEEIVTNIVQTLFNNFKNEIKKEVDEHITKALQEQSEEIKKLKQRLEENIVRINKKLIEQHTENGKLSRDIDYVYNRAEEAISMANYNEQYSRKFNIKVTNFSVDTDTDIKEKFIEMVKDDLKLELDERDVVAIHKLKTKKPVATPPVIVKVLNSDIKTQIMRRRKETKDNVRLYDDITYKNQELIQKLKRHKEISAAYYFNCAVYGKTKDGLQIRFDVSDNIYSKIDNELSRAQYTHKPESKNIAESVKEDTETQDSGK